MPEARTHAFTLYLKVPSSLANNEDFGARLTTGLLADTGTDTTPTGSLAISFERKAPTIARAITKALTDLSVALPEAEVVEPLEVPLQSGGRRYISELVRHPLGLTLASLKTRQYHATREVNPTGPAATRVAESNGLRVKGSGED